MRNFALGRFHVGRNGIKACDRDAGQGSNNEQESKQTRHCVWRAPSGYVALSRCLEYGSIAGKYLMFGNENVGIPGYWPGLRPLRRGFGARVGVSPLVSPVWGAFGFFFGLHTGLACS